MGERWCVKFCKKTSRKFCEKHPAPGTSGKKDGNLQSQSWVQWKLPFSLGLWCKELSCGQELAESQSQKHLCVHRTYENFPVPPVKPKSYEILKVPFFGSFPSRCSWSGISHRVMSGDCYSSEIQDQVYFDRWIIVCERWERPWGTGPKLLSLNSSSGPLLAALILLIS